MASITFPTAEPISIPFSDLQDKSKDLSAKIEEGFGHHGLGIITVANVPGFYSLRQNILQFAPRVAKLPDHEKKELEDPESRYNFGWSHGKQTIEPGKLDRYKGSFFANPFFDVPTADNDLMRRYPAFCRSNKWPTSLPELEAAFKAVGNLILEVGLMLAYHCDEYLKKHMKVHEDKSIEQILKRSRCHKGRLLYYVPRDSSVDVDDASSISSWFGWHTDFGSLTGITCGMFTRNGERIACPDTAAGLYVRTRNGQIVKIVFKEDEIAYQIGETTEILSEGHLCATPHCVQAPKGESAVGVDRSSFALFMQPDWDESLRFPAVIHHHRELIPPNGTLTFGEYSRKIIAKHYA